MKIFNKSIKEYIKTINTFLLIIIAITMIQIVSFILEVYPRIFIDPIGLIKIIFVTWAGLFVVKKYKFNLKQTAVTGFIIFILTGWFLPFLIFFQSNSPIIPFIFRIINFILLVLSNLIIYIFAAIFGGWLAQKKLKK
ncbi:MAG: hypothetical protein QXF15_01165 [Candidatus Aenigmatarchaeota archaeon]